MAESAVREAFRSQAAFCARLGSPFTGRLCGAIAARLDRETAIGRRIFDWPGDPSASHDNLPLRLCGGLHALVRAGRSPSLAALYPPAPLPAEDELAEVVQRTLAADGEWLDPWLDNAPQTNEVGRSAVLMSGLLAIADRFGLPLRLYELGASAGLNLQLDRYGYDLGGRRSGDRQSPVQLQPLWQGAPPPDAEVRIAGRAGVDISPMDPAKEGERLLAYIWPDQPERLARAAAALAIARSVRLSIERGDAADWIEHSLPIQPTAGLVRVVLHSIAFQYFPEATRARVRTHIEAAGAAATERAPVAWLRFELLPDEPSSSLRLRTWPGEERLIAWAHPHGTEVRWL